MQTLSIVTTNAIANTTDESAEAVVPIVPFSSGWHRRNRRMSAAKLNTSRHRTSKRYLAISGIPSSWWESCATIWETCVEWRPGSLCSPPFIPTEPPRTSDWPANTGTKSRSAKLRSAISIFWGWLLHVLLHCMDAFCSVAFLFQLCYFLSFQVVSLFLLCQVRRQRGSKISLFVFKKDTLLVKASSNNFVTLFTCSIRYHGYRVFSFFRFFVCDFWRSSFQMFYTKWWWKKRWHISAVRVKGHQNSPKIEINS